MASVSSLDRDMRNIRLSKYTPHAANESRTWIEDALGEKLKAGDLLEALKDGIALCKLVNLVTSPGVRYKESSMPFVQMENISHFLRACQSPPLSLHSHDIFQTVALYESKDPAQVLQCIAAFSRRAHALQPARFPDIIGEKGRAGSVTPQGAGSVSGTGPNAGESPIYGRVRTMSNATDNASNSSSEPSQGIGGSGARWKSPTSKVSAGDSRTSSPSAGGVSSWSKKTDEGATMPAWNIAQYGYMGGASQGNQGIAFGARRQITTPGPKIPTLAEKERKRREQEAEEEKIRMEHEEAERRSISERLADEERARVAEQQRYEEEAGRQREKERQRIEGEKKRWQEEERRWKEEEEARAREEREVAAKLASERDQKRSSRDVKLTGQYLSQYQAQTGQGATSDASGEQARIHELERQLEEAKAREAQYERERRGGVRTHHTGSRDRSRSTAPNGRDRSRSKSRGRHAHAQTDTPEIDTWQADERDYLPEQPRPLPTPQVNKAAPPPQAPTYTTNASSSPPASPIPPRPLPNPANYTTPRPPSASPTRKSPFTRPTATPSPPPPASPIHQPSNPQSRSTSPTKQQQSASPITNPLKKPPFTHPSSLLSREMELDRQRQAEWEEAQNQKRPGGLSAGNTGRRQLVGPRELPGKNAGNMDAR